MKQGSIRSRLLQLIDGFDRVSVLALVDLVADEYIYGQISRVSREAPVLILDYDGSQIVPGGGANAVYNIAALGGEAVTVGVVGSDNQGDALLSTLSARGISRKWIHRAKAYQTPTKTRILAGGAHSTKQQVVRIDRRTRMTLDAAKSKQLEASTLALIAKVDIAMVSDYDYGWVSPGFANRVAARARRNGKKSVLDSRFSLLSYSGFYSATPNEPEVEAALGVMIGNDLATLERSGRTLLRKLGTEAILITRGRDGMALFEKRRKTRHIPIYGSDDVADVTGAGDTVLSTFTLALGAGATPSDAAILANYAGGLVVMKRGTAAVTGEELAAAVSNDPVLS